MPGRGIGGSQGSQPIHLREPTKQNSKDYGGVSLKLSEETRHITHNTRIYSSQKNEYQISEYVNVSFTQHILIIHMHMHISDKFLIVAESHEILVLPPNLIILVQIIYQHWPVGSLDSRGGSYRSFPYST